MGDMIHIPSNGFTLFHISTGGGNAPKYEGVTILQIQTSIQPLILRVGFNSSKLEIKLKISLLQSSVQSNVFPE